MESPSQPEAQAPILAPGQVLAGKYRVERMLGRGGMAEVYAAHHEILHQTVALKVLLPAVAAIPGAATRFLNEARSAARIRSEHVASVMDVGMREDGSAYIVLEYLDGEELQKLIDRRGPLPPAEAVDYVLQALEAIAHAHAIGIVHRDLKPSNIFLARAAGGVTVVKVFDFGISKAPKSSESVDESSTASQVILGTPTYMAPEQARSAKDVDARADIWAVGVILYRLMTGTLPFDADTIADMLAAILVQPHRPMRLFHPELSIELDAIVSKCLAKNRNDRYRSVSELAAALSSHATAGGRMSVERISRTLGVVTPSPAFESNKTQELPAPNLPPVATPVGAVTKPEGKTDPGWMEASVAKPPQGPAPAAKRRLWGAGISVGALVVVVSVVVLRISGGGAPATTDHRITEEPAAPHTVVAAAVPSIAPAPQAAPVPAAPTAVVDAGAPLSAASSPVAPSPVSPSSAVSRAVPAERAKDRGHAAPRPSSSPAAPSATAYDILDQRN
jgi:serine/threonine protein kinase